MRRPYVTVGGALFQQPSDCDPQQQQQQQPRFPSFFNFAAAAPAPPPPQQHATPHHAQSRFAGAAAAVAAALALDGGVSNGGGGTCGAVLAATPSGDLLNPRLALAHASADYTDVFSGGDGVPPGERRDDEGLGEGLGGWLYVPASKRVSVASEGGARRQRRGEAAWLPAGCGGGAGCGFEGAGGAGAGSGGAWEAAGVSGGAV